MSEQMDWLDDAIVDYLRTHAAIKRLEESGRIVRHNHAMDGWGGQHHFAPRGDHASAGIRAASRNSDRTAGRSRACRFFLRFA